MGENEKISIWSGEDGGLGVGGRDLSFVEHFLLVAGYSSDGKGKRGSFHSL